MATEPNLRTLREGREPSGEADSRGAEPRAPRGFVMGLAIALLVAIALLIWSRVELSRTSAALEEEIRSLRTEAAGLRTDVSARDLLVQRQRQRLEEVRDEVRGIGRLLDEPFPEYGGKP